MARIRSVKPEFHTDRRLALDLTRDQRLFYQGMWNFADDEGRLVADPRGLLGEIFRYEKDLDEVWVETLLVRLVLTHRAVLYEVGGEQICQLGKFLKHQKISHPTPSKLAPPPKKMASPLGWLSVRYSGAALEALRPEVEVEVEVEQGTGNREGESREGSASLEDLAPTLEHRITANRLHIDVDAEFRKWRLQRQANGVTPADPGADFELWLERAPGFNSNSGNGRYQEQGPPSPSLAMPPEPEPEIDPEERAEIAKRAAELKSRLRPPMPVEVKS